MRNIAFLRSERYQDQQGRANRNSCHPDMLEFERKLVKKLAKLGIPVFCHAAYRSDQEQNQLFVKGFSKAKGGESPHNYGLAVDIIHSTQAWGLTAKQWLIISHVAKELSASLGIPVEWGGDWDKDPLTGVGWDPAHWQLADWRGIGRSWQG